MKWLNIKYHEYITQYSYSYFLHVVMALILCFYLRALFSRLLFWGKLIRPPMFHPRHPGRVPRLKLPPILLCPRPRERKCWLVGLLVCSLVDKPTFSKCPSDFRRLWERGFLEDRINQQLRFSLKCSEISATVLGYEELATPYDYPMIMIRISWSSSSSSSSPSPSPSSSSSSSSSAAKSWSSAKVPLWSWSSAVVPS